MQIFFFYPCTKTWLPIIIMLCVKTKNNMVSPLHCEASQLKKVFGINLFYFSYFSSGFSKRRVNGYLIHFTQQCDACRLPTLLQTVHINSIHLRVCTGYGWVNYLLYIKAPIFGIFSVRLNFRLVLKSLTVGSAPVCRASVAVQTKR